MEGELVELGKSDTADLTLIPTADAPKTGYWRKNSKSLTSTRNTASKKRKKNTPSATS
jgi:hypothetical protein